MADQPAASDGTQSSLPSQPVPSSTKQATVNAEDSDPDFDDLDDVLDQFSANAPKQSQPTPAPTLSEPGKPEPSDTQPATEPVIPPGPKPDETEEEFIARLSSEMSTMLSSLNNDPAASAQSPEDIAKMGADLEAFTKKMEAEGIKPEDLLKAILGEDEGGKLAESARQEAKSDAKGDTKAGTTTFEDTIRRTMSRLDQSNTEATNAAAQSSSKSEEDLLAEMLKAMDAGGEGGEDGLSKMFLDMMNQLTHKEMLYEPMRELNSQYPSWLESHKPPKLSQAEHDRYSRQSTIVADIVQKFEEPGFSDDDPKCREYIWEKMQAMQSEGAPPEELVKNPFPGTDFGGGIPGLGGGGEGMEGLEEGCPTQ